MKIIMNILRKLDLSPMHITAQRIPKQTQASANPNMALEQLSDWSRDELNQTN